MADFLRRRIFLVAGLTVMVVAAAASIIITDGAVSYADHRLAHRRPT